MRAYGNPAESRYQTARRLAENEQRRAVANRCTGRRKSTATNPLPHVYEPIGNGDLMGCKHCPLVRQLTNVEYRRKYGVNRPPPRPVKRRRRLPVWMFPFVGVGAIGAAGATGSPAAVLVVGAVMLVVGVLWVLNGD